MKTNANMVRKIGSFDVIQRTKDGMFNATALLKQWNESNGMKKEVKDFFDNKQTSEFIEVLVTEENLNRVNSPYLEMPDKERITKERDPVVLHRGNYPYVKSRNSGNCNSLNNLQNLHGRNSAYVKSRASRGVNAGTWMHPFLFIKFAMWLNPRFEYQVIKFVYDELIKHRHSAGDYYNKLCGALSKFDDVDYREVGKILNYVVFDTHERAIRNRATPEQEEDLQQLERDMCQYIEMGFVNSYNQFKAIMRKEWNKRHNKAPVLLN